MTGRVHLLFFGRVGAVTLNCFVKFILFSLTFDNTLVPVSFLVFLHVLLWILCRVFECIFAFMVYCGWLCVFLALIFVVLVLFLALFLVLGVTSNLCRVPCVFVVVLPVCFWTLVGL